MIWPSRERNRILLTGPPFARVVDAMIFAIDGIEDVTQQKHTLRPWKRTVTRMTVELTTQGNNSIFFGNDETNAKTRPSRFIRCSETISLKCLVKKRSRMEWSRGESGRNAMKMMNTATQITVIHRMFAQTRINLARGRPAAALIAGGFAVRLDKPSRDQLPRCPVSPLNLSDPKAVRWIVVTLSIFTVVVLAIAVFGRATTVEFKSNILTQVMPSLLAGLVAIAAIMERAVAVLNDIWFGKEREEKEEHVRETSKQLEAARAELHSAWQLHAQLAQEAVRTGNQPAITQASAGPPALATLQSNVTKPAQELDQAGKDLANVTWKQSRVRLVFGFAVALIVSAVGVSTLTAMLEVGGLSSQQRAVFRAVDILLTAGLLSGGTSGISAITELLGTYANVLRKDALKKP